MATVRPAIIVGTALLSMAACADDAEGTASPPAALRDDAITVGSFAFPESILLAELYSQALESNGFRVERAVGLGPREFVGPALDAGLIELVPEYGGTAVAYFSAGHVPPSGDPASNHAALKSIVEGSNIAVLDAAPAQNVNTFVVSEQLAREHELTTLSDLATAAPELVLGGPSECARRPLCQVGLREVYGLEFAEFVALEASGTVTHRALTDGFVDVALLFSTDPELVDFVALTDDRHLQPAENVTPLVRTEVVERWGADVVTVINSVSHELDTDALRRLNAADAATAGTDDVKAIAAGWLRSRGLT
jgi:osmoprotectant transport system substrate-binding protein